jgi:hypothetical protein
MCCQNFSNAHCQTTRPSSGFGGINWLNAAFHSSNGSLSFFSGLVTGISKQGIDFTFHRLIHLDERRPGTFETFAGNFLRRVNAARKLMVHG